MRTGFIIDKITESIEEVATGKSFENDIILASVDEIKKIDITFYRIPAKWTKPNQLI